MNKIRLEEDIKKRLEENEKIRIENIRLVYKKRIKETFLISEYKKIRKITDEYKTIRRFYPEISQKDFDNLVYIPTTIDLDVCNHIVGIHTYNTLFVDEVERAKLQNDKKYLEQLENDVISQIKLRKYGSKTIRQDRHFGRFNYLWYPPVYALYNVTTYVLVVLSELINSNPQNILLDTCLLLLKKSVAIIALIDYDNLENAYPILRSAIEVLISYMAIADNLDAQDEYMKFNQYKLYYTNTGKFDDEFYERYKKLNNKQIKEIDYLNYGWLDSIFEANYANTKKSFKFYDVLNYVEMKLSKFYSDNSLKYFSTAYKKYHVMTHGNIMTIDLPITHLLDIITTTSIIVTRALEFLGVIYNIKFEYEGVNLRKLLRDNASRVNKISNNLTDEMIKNYERNAFKF